MTLLYLVEVPPMPTSKTNLEELRNSKASRRVD